MELGFDDGLSEDWISQPRSSGTPSARDESILSQQTTANTPLTRIPRPKTASEVPISSRKARPLDLSSQVGVPGGSSRRISRHFSSRSLSSLPHGTVQQNASKNINGGHNDAIPEWRRRLLQNNKGSGAQRDLFSPMGLEQAFQPPEEPESPTRRRTKGVSAPAVKQLDIFPSSPPIVPKSVSLEREPELEKSSQRSARDTSEPPLTAYKWDAERVDDISLPPMQPLKSDKQKAAYENADNSHDKDDGDSGEFTKKLHSKLQDIETKNQRSSSRSLKEVEKSEEDRDLGVDPDSASLHHAQINGSVTGSLGEGETSLANDAFVTLERGGHSVEDSFLERSLSAVSLADLGYPQAPTPPVVDLKNPPEYTSERPLTPEEQVLRPLKVKPSGSPLKLFDKYDTFTNACLNRRVSQFEDRSFTNSDTGTHDPRMSRSSPPRPQRQSQNGVSKVDSHRVSNFGQGQLDSFDFQHRQPSKVHSSPANDEDQENQPPLPELDRNSHTRFRAYHSTRQVLRERRNNIEKISHKDWGDSQDLNTEELSDRRVQTFNEEGKRIPSSPQKKRESKRRRTSDLMAGAAQTALFEEQKVQSPSAASSAAPIAGKKRKDARYEKSSQTANPEIIATRHMLRPRPSSGSARVPSTTRQTSVSVSLGPGNSSQRVDISTEFLADQLASFANGIAGTVSQGIRKKSVNTADYFREANIIMQNIRAQARPPVQSSPNSKDQDRLSNVEESLFDEYTLDEFSRPASREGNRARPKNEPKPVSARVVSVLRKFHESNEPDDIDQSIDFKSHHGDEILQPDESVPPNIRIHERPQPAEDHESSQYQSTSSQELGSNRSLADASGRSIPTNSSGSNGRPQVILPGTVSHILGENIGKMTYDPKQQRWVKRKASKVSTTDHDAMDSELTEDDPFKEIPDLDVDESQELKHVRTSSNTAGHVSNTSAHGDPVAKEQQDSQSRPQSSGTTGSRDNESSAITKLSKFASSGPIIETRATSWGDQALIVDKQTVSQSNGAQEPQQAISEQDLAPLSSAVNSKNEDQEKGKETKNQPRCVTVMFSSPPLDPVPDEKNKPTDLEIWEDESVLNSPQDRDEIVQQFSSSGTNRSVHIQRGNRQRSRQFSVGNRRFTPRPISRIDEDDEWSLIKQDSAHARNMQLALSTPQPLRDMPGTLTMPPSSHQSSVVGFHLSPLPDFTVNTDESMNLDVDYVTRRRGLLSLQDVENKFSLAIKELVQRITDIEPYEPYWEYIKKLELRGKNLLTLHMLDEFCQRIEELDVSENELGQVNGAPSSIRVLNISDNCLSGMTAWGHLQNLQYLNVSGNNIDTLRGFSNLIHLRELNAENNKLLSLEGIMSLDGLLRLNVGQNSIEELDFTDASLHRLVELYAFDNQIVSVNGLQNLHSLEKVGLENNKLRSFATQKGMIPRTLVSIDLSKNSLSALDLTDAPWIKRLVLDSNHLMTIEGLDRMRKLYHLSWRNQTPSSVMSHELEYQSCAQAHTVALSGNRLALFAPATMFLNIRRLELASCGLSVLSEKFGSLMPNLRILNLNYNGIRDLRPLTGVTDLEELHIVGNRVTRLRQTTSLFARLSKSLRVIDCRNNPLTHGFYSPKTQTKRADLSTSLIKPNNWTSCQAPQDSSILAELSYLAPAARGDANYEYEKRLDAETMYRRQVYEVLVMEGCKKLETLDGRDVESMEPRDRKTTLRRLVELGILKHKAGGLHGGE